MTVDVGNHVIQVFKGEHRQNRAEISSCITASSMVTPSSTVGSMRRAPSSYFPPKTVFGPSISPSRRRKCFSLTIFPY